MRDGGQLLYVELKAAVAIDADSLSATATDTDANARGNAVSHCPQTRGVEHASSFSRPISEKENFDGAPRVSGDDAIIRSNFLTDNFSQVVDTDESGSAVLGLNDRITGLPVLAALDPGAAVFILVE